MMGIVYTITTAESRLSKNWKQVRLNWADFVAQQCTPKVDNLPQASYEAKTKKQKVDLKDAGGYVAGLMTEGQRVKRAFGDRCWIVLDADNVGDSEAFLLDVDLALAGYKYLVVSTRSHNPDNGAYRYRLIVPMLEVVADADKYSAASRKLAELIGIKYFDSTTFQHTRLMFNTSISRGQEFYSHESAGTDAVSADHLCSLYADWRDKSSWACHEAVSARVSTEAAKQADPVSKPGLVGMFCRAYSIAEAVDTFLGDIYEPGSVEGKYTYIGASTVDGAIVYGNFLYSYHASDPHNHKLLNAYDLVRLHKFTELDVDSHDTPANRLPSVKAMQELCNSDAKFQDARASSAAEDFEVLAEKVKGDRIHHQQVRKLLETDKKGNVICNEANYAIIVNRDDAIANIYYDLFTDSLKVIQDDGRHVVFKESTYMPFLRRHIGGVYNIRHNQMLDDALVDSLPQVHPVQEALLAAERGWDGVKRIEGLLPEFFLCERNAYTAGVMRKWMIAAVKRMFEPGCKFDNLLMLSGAQGFGKTTFLRMLAMDPTWYTDDIGDISHKDARQALHQGVWIMEFSEAAALTKAEAAAMKSFISASEDMFRASFGRRTTKHARCNVFAATTNADKPLRDPTGNRRFWVVKCEGRGRNPQSVTLAEVMQLWGEAMHYFRTGESLELDEAAQKQALYTQTSSREKEEWEELLDAYLTSSVPIGWHKLDAVTRAGYLADEAFGDLDTSRREYVSVAVFMEEVLGMNKISRQAANNRGIAKAIRYAIEHNPHTPVVEAVYRDVAFGTQRGYMLG